jgi:osmotically-inducible protein OsmY
MTQSPTRRDIAETILALRGVDVHATGANSRADDIAIRDAFLNTVASEREFSNCAMRVRDRDRVVVHRDPDGERSGEVDVAIDDGVIRLEGDVISLSHKRALGVIAWWTPGCRDVDNRLSIEPDERDGDEEIDEALRLVLEMDRLLDADQITTHTRDGVVTLDGYVANEAEHRRAQLDAWALFGVREVVDRIEVQA